MPIAAPIQSNFSGGEIGARVQGRVDFETYKKSVAVMLNFIATLEGAVIRRPGTSRAASVKDSSKNTSLLSFVFSNAQAYILECGDEYIRFFSQESQLIQQQVITGITRANPAVVTSNAHGYINGMLVQIVSVVGMTEINGLTASTANVTANTFELAGLNSTGFTAYSSGGLANAVYEIVSPYDSTDVSNLYTAQSGDTMYIAHGDYAPYTLTRLASGFFSIAKTVFTDGPYLDANIINTGSPSTQTITTSGTTGSITLTASGAIFTLVTDVGRLVRLKQGTAWFWFVITAVASTTSATATVMTTCAAAVSTVWRLGLWSDTTGWPACVTFHEGRLWWAGSAGAPQRVVSSVSASYLDMAPTDGAGAVAATNAVSIDIASGDINQVVWMVSNQKGLQCGTVGSEFVITSGATADFIQPTSVFARRHSSNGSLAIRPAVSGRSTVYVQRSGLKLRDMSYSFSVDGFESEDLTVLNPEVSISGLKQLAYVREPIPIIWGCRNDGLLIGLTYQRDTNALRAGWHRHVMGGTYRGQNAVVRSVASIPVSTGNLGFTTMDELWMIVLRTINGSDVQFVERMYANFEDYGYKTPMLAKYLDGSITNDEAFAISAATQAAQCQLTVTGAGFGEQPLQVGWTCVVDGVQGMDELNGRIFLITRVQGTVALTIDIASADYNGPPAVDITGITQANPAVVTSVAHGFQAGAIVSISGVAGMTGINGAQAVIGSVTANTFAMTTVNSTAYGAYTSGGNALDLTGTTPVASTDYGAFVASYAGTAQAYLFTRVPGVSGMGTYEAADLTILRDGAPQHDVTVAGGILYYDPYAAEVVAGFPYNSDLQLLRMDAGANNGTSGGKTQRVHRVGVQTYQQGNLRIGYDFDNLQLLQERDSDTPAMMGEEVQSGWVTVQPKNTTPSLDTRICIRCSDPLPCTILAIAPMLETQDRS